MADITNKSGKGKVNGYSNVVRKAKLKRQWQDANYRQAEHDSLTTAEKLAKAKTRRGESKREIVRLTKKLEWEKAQKITAAAKAKESHPAPLTKAQKSEKDVKRAKDSTDALPKTRKRNKKSQDAAV